jgi:hypothetical protein
MAYNKKEVYMDINAIFNGRHYETESDKVDFKRWLERIQPALEKRDVKEALTDNDFLCQMFYLQKGSGVSRQSYQKIKKHVQTLLDFFSVDFAVPNREAVLNAQEVTCFYKDLKSLIAFVDSVGESKLHNYKPFSDLLNIKAIVVLGWHGLSLSEAASLEKTAISKNGELYFAGRVKVDEQSYNILKNLSSSDDYRGFPVGKLQKYRSDDKYLFRSVIAKQLINENHLANFLKRFNLVAASTKHAVVFRHLRKNALFIEVNNDKKEEKMSEKIIKHLGCDQKTAYGVEKEFNKWKGDHCK